MMRLRPARSWRADSFLMKPSDLIAAWTRLRVDSATTPGRLSTLDTVPTETPARAATSLMLTGASATASSCAASFMGPSGALLGNPVHYRDRRTDGVADRVLAAVPAAELYAVTGIQHLAFNTIYQLAATPMLRQARTMLLIPDLLAYWLTGEAGAEITNASTTSLFDVRAQAWATELIRKAGLPPRIFPPLRRPGDVIGPLIGPNGPGTSLPLIAVGSHDTASAVAGVPAEGPDFAYISSGTWSLAGVELDAPVLTEASRAANFTNETGIDGTIRYLRNVMGLWLLQESLRGWPGASLESLLEEAARLPSLRFVIDPDDPVFLSPGDMPGRIASWLAGRDEAVPAEPAETVRCILDSLALAYRRAIGEAQSLSAGGTRTWCTSSAAGPATRCSASSPPTPPGCP